MGEAMTLHRWSSSSLHYGRKLVDSGLEGARSAEQAFMAGSRLTPYLNRSVRIALGPAALGACLGLISGHPRARRRSATRSLVFGILGGFVGFSAGVAWETRRLAATVAHGAIRNIGRTRDEHWLERNPIDYA
jgi:hypothetical protein